MMLLQTGTGTLLLLPLLHAALAWAQDDGSPRPPIYHAPAVKPRSMLVCNANNCLRAYQHTVTSAMEFCATYIESTVTTTVTPTM